MGSFFCAHGCGGLGGVSGSRKLDSAHAFALVAESFEGVLAALMRCETRVIWDACSSEAIMAQVSMAGSYSASVLPKVHATPSRAVLVSGGTRRV